MKQSNAAKSSVAWFRLAECVNRKERERAFQLYRLLIHSFDDNTAFLKKLEGDMWFEFDLSQSLKCYATAADTYKKNNNYYESYIIYKKLSELVPDNLTYKQALEEVLQYLSHLK